MFAPESQTKTEEQPPTLAEIIREVTNNGQTIIDFFHDAMKGRLDGFEPCHRIAAARELAKRGDKEAIAFLQSFYPQSNRRKSNGRKPSPANGEYLTDDEIAPNYELAEIVREVTDNGRTIVCFLHDAMQGILDGFKPCHRVACGKELLRRGFDIIPADYDHDEYEDHDDVQQSHDEPFDQKKYARERFMRDGADGKALRHIYGSEEAVTVACRAVVDHRNNTVLDNTHIPDWDFTPIDNPGDDPYGKGCFGYETLRLSFNDNQAIRAANKAVAEYKKQKAQHPPEDPDPPPSPVSPERPQNPLVGAGFKPARGLTHPSTGRESETGQPSEDPDPPSPVPPERPQNPPIGAGFKPARGLTHPSTERHSDPAEEPAAPTPPPRKRPRKIHLGPPDEEPPDDSPRQRKDPGEIRIPLRNLLSITASPL